MADTKEKRVTKEAEVVKTNASTTGSKLVEKSATIDRKTFNKWLAGTALAAAVVGLIVGAVVGSIRAGHGRFGAPDFDNDKSGRTGTMMRGDDGPRSGMMRGAVDASTMVHGTVTEVNETTMKVAGNGVVKTVTLNDKTTYGTKKPAVNDSVMVRGTTSGDTFTATSVQVVNR